MELEELVKWLVAVLVLVVLVWVFYTLFVDNQGTFLDTLKNLWKFGR